MGTSAYLIATAALHPSVAVLQVPIVGVRFFGIGRAASRYLERLVSHSVNFRHLARLRVWFYRQAEPRSPAGLMVYRSADLLNRAIADIETLENFYVRAVAPPLSAMVIIVGAGWFMGSYDLRLAELLVASLFISGVGLPLLLYWLNRIPGAAMVERRADLQGQLLDVFQGMPDLLAFGQGEAHLERIQSASENLGWVQWRVNLNGALANMISLLLSGITLLGILLLAIPQVGLRFDGVILAVLTLVCLSSFESVSPLIPAAQHLESCIQAGQRLFALENITPECVAPSEPYPAPQSSDLFIQNLHFSYAGDPSFTLEGLDLDLPPGRHVALVGPSGAGKTTLANLLLRFWDFQQGSIDLDGKDIRQYDPQDVRKMLTVVSQPSFLFNTTLRQNMLIACPGATPAELDEAVKMARLDAFVERLPQGLDTLVGDRGLQLSGGERQRMIIARALLRNSPIWILDEPTANLDAEMERVLLQILRQASQRKSVITITHRLVDMENFDEILVLSQGRVVERGTHASLLSQQGLYARMWKIQQEILE